MRINYNVSALLANKALNQNDNKLTSASERLSTGYKINHAKDNPSGLAIAKRMNMQLRGLSNASQNASDGVSIVQTAEGALQEMQSMVQRISELSVQAANGTNSDSEREMVQMEVDQLKQEVTRIAEDTEFNGQKLLNGDCDLKGYASAQGVKVSYYSDEVSVGKYLISAINPQYDADGNLTDGSVTLSQTGDNAFPADAFVSYDGNKVTVTARDSFEITFSLDKTVTSLQNVTLDITGLGAMRMQIGANEGEVMEIRIPTVSLETMGLDKADVTTEDGAKATIGMAKNANSYISSVRSRLGAYQNRLEHTADSLDVTNENVTEAYSRIMDTDMAEEMTEYTNLQVLTQAGTSILAQANERPQQVLQLLQ
jgi:flagellin